MEKRLLAVIIYLTGITLNAQTKWAIQRENIDIDDITYSGFDLVIIDYSWDGTEFYAFNNTQVHHMQSNPAGHSRRIFCYFDVSTLHEGDSYFKRKWKKTKPTWVNENYSVKQWNTEWKNIIKNHIHKFIIHDFDGIYLAGFDKLPSSIQETALKEINEWIKKETKEKFEVYIENGSTVKDNLKDKSLFDGTIESKELSSTIAGKDNLALNLTTDSTSAYNYYKAAKSKGFSPYVTDSNMTHLEIHPGIDPEIQKHEVHQHNNRITPGQFFSITVPNDLWRLGYEYHKEYTIIKSDEILNLAMNDYERLSSHTISLSHGVGKHWEIGMYLPLEFYDFNGHSTTDYSSIGLGNTGFFLLNSYSWNHGNDNLLAECSLETPTGKFNLEHTLALNAEHYFGAFGLTFRTGFISETDQNYGNGSIIGELKAGFGWQVNNRLFLSGQGGLEGSNLFTELSVEFLQAHYSSWAIFCGAYPNDYFHYTYVGVSLNHLRTNKFRRVWW